MGVPTGESPTAASEALGIGPVIAGRYRVRERLGRGAAKQVYLARDERLDREVAIALMFAAGDGDAARRRVAREARATGRLGDHPNIITVYDTGEHRGVPYLVLRAMRGGSLADLLKRRRLSVDDVVRLGSEIAAALAHAHRHDVVHRDVKPDNVWLTGDGGAALGDFGIAWRAGEERLTSAGIVLGTVRYLSPEQISGDDPGPASDLYALGVTLYELATGRPPFRADDPAQVLSQHLTAAPVPPSELGAGIPPRLEWLILALLAKQPAGRPATAADVVRALDRISLGCVDRAAAGARSAEDHAASPQPVRRVASVLAARVPDDDPEVMHEVLQRCSRLLEHRGAGVERHLGHTLVAFFGLTPGHDDDAARAARAAVSLRAQTPGLKIAIESGEIFVPGRKAGSATVTGGPISAASRLAERAQPGEILLGPGARGAIRAEASVDPASGRLIELRDVRPGILRAAVTPFVNRTGELEQLHAAFERAREDNRCRLVTVLGAAGIGKSRLVGEFLEALDDDVTILAGRCPAPGEGTALHALAEIVRSLGGEPRSRLEDLLRDDRQALRAILAAIGISDEPTQPEETALALRRLLARLARTGPVVVAVEDIHWAPAVVLDALDNVAALSRGSPILVVCLARPDLLETRSDWAAPQPNRAVLMLDALDEDSARELAQMLGAEQRSAGIARRAEGNPLFVEQLVAVGADEGDELPASIQSLLAARVDRLPPGERLLLQHGSVEGRTFHAGTLAALLPEGEHTGTGTQLVALVRKGLIGADEAHLAGEDAFSFTHALIREAVYASVPKQLRAELHARIADRLEHASAASHVVGVHLERAYRLASELGRAGEPERALGSRAAEHLAVAARAALWRGDPSGAAELLTRAVSLVGTDAGANSSLLPALGASLFEAGEITEATAVLDRAMAGATDPLVRARARIEREIVRLEGDPAVDTTASRRVADALLPLLEQRGDHHCQCRAWWLRAQTEWFAGHVERADEAWAMAAVCAERAGDKHASVDVLGWRATAAVLGPTPVDAAIAWCEAARAQVAASPVAVAWIVNPLASLHAMRGDVDAADTLLREAATILRELGSLGASSSHHEALVRLLAGQPALAEAALRRDVATLSSMADVAALATTTAMLAQAVFAQGRMSEARELCDSAQSTAAAGDIVTQAIWRGVKARVLAHDGHFGDALTLAGEAVSLLEPTDLLSHRGDASLDLAEVLRMNGDRDASRRTLRCAVAFYERKGNAVGAARAREMLNHYHEEA